MKRRLLDWQYRAQYIRGKHGVRAAWANEAFADHAAVVESPDHASKSGETDRLVGYSPTAGMVITVIYLRDQLVGVNAWPANPTDIRRYYEEE
jgi:hypothetical protein